MNEVYLLRECLRHQMKILHSINVDSVLFWFNVFSGSFGESGMYLTYY